MAKFGQGAGPVRPMPNPRLTPNAQTAQPAQRSNGMSQAQYDMAMGLISSAMSSAQNTGSPLAAFLAPLAGAMMGKKAIQSREEARSAEDIDLAGPLLGAAGDTPEAQRALAVLQNPNAPDYLKSIAKQQLAAAMKANPVAAGSGGGGSAPRRSSGGGSRSSGSGTGSGRERLYGEYMIDGVYHGRTKDGRFIPYVDGAGNPVTAPDKSGKKPKAVEEAAAAPTYPVAPEAPALPADPSLDNDPLGLR